MRPVLAALLIVATVFVRGDTLPGLEIEAAVPDEFAGTEAISAGIRAAMDDRDPERAEHLLRELERGDGAAFVANNFDYLLARLARRRGDLREAERLFRSVRRRNSMLAAHSVWHLAEIARATQDLSQERQLLDGLTRSHPSSSLVTRARDRIIDSLLQSGDYRPAIPLLKPIASTRGVRGRSATARLADAYSRLGDEANARTLYEQLGSGSRDDYALAAAEGLDALDRASRRTPSEFDSMRRARIYLSNRHWGDARPHLLNIVEKSSDPSLLAEAMFQIGTTFYREDKHDEAVKWFDRTHGEFASKKEGEQGYYYVASTLQRARRYDAAVRRYVDFLSAYPRSDLAEAAYRNIVDSLRYAGKDDEAVEWSRRIMDRFASKPLATVGLFNHARIELSRGRLNEALTLLTRLQGHAAQPRLFGGPARGEAAYLRAVTIEQLGRPAEAARLYLAIADDRDAYFGQRATARLQALAMRDEGRRVVEPLAARYRTQARAALRSGLYEQAKDAANQALRVTTSPRDRSEMLDVLRASYSRLPAYSRALRYNLIPLARQLITDGRPRRGGSNRELAAELFFLGLYDEGARELRTAGIGGLRSENEASDEVGTETRLLIFAEAQGDAAYSMAVYCNRGDLANHAIAFGESALKSVPRDYRLELMPRDLAELAYPAPYRDELIRYAGPADVDPRLILAIARQESRFDASAKSPAAARGLLQFIAETAHLMAQQERIEGFQLDDVYEPAVAIRLASRYIANLQQMFPTNPFAVLCSYSGGEQSVERWIYRSRSDDPDRLVAEVAFPETKDYVAKVMTNYRAYQRLYDAKLRPALR